MRLRLSTASVLVALATGASIVGAQQPAAPAMPTVPASTCVKPEVPNRIATPARVNAFNRDYKVYGECINKYVRDTNSLATASIAAGKAAIEELEAVNAEVKAKSDN